MPEQDSHLLSHYNPQGEWTPTVPRGPVAAIYKSPGPAIVCLPSTVGEAEHDPTRTKAPGYVIGIKTGLQVKPLGPGPGKYDLRGWTNKGYDKCCAPFIATRLPELKRFRTPGPAAYHRGVSDNAVFTKPPAYTMRMKGITLKKLKTPAPNAYNIAPVVGYPKTTFTRAPAYTMRLKLEGALGRKMMNPGPAAYMLPSSNVYKTRPPKYTMSTKAGPPVDATQKPGPGAHFNELVKFTRYSAPKYTFGIKHSPYVTFPGFAAEK